MPDLTVGALRDFLDEHYPRGEFDACEVYVHQDGDYKHIVYLEAVLDQDYPLVLSATLPPEGDESLL